MKHYKLLETILRNQQKPPKGPGFWDKIEFEKEEDEGTIKITLPEDYVGFVFSKRTGKLMYIYNWKD